MDPAPQAEVCYLNTPQLARLLGFHRKSIWRMVQRKRLPPPAKLSRTCVRWLLSDVKAWMDKKARRGA